MISTLLDFIKKKGRNISKFIDYFSDRLSAISSFAYRINRSLDAANLESLQNIMSKKKGRSDRGNENLFFSNLFTEFIG